MKLFFILGRNPELSRLELYSFFEARQRQFSELFFEGNILLLEVNDDEKINIQEFGGIIKMGRIVFEGKKDHLRGFLRKEELIPSDKFTYTLYGNLDGEPLKDRFKEEKKKAIFKSGSRRLKLQDGSFASLAKVDFSLFFQQIGEYIFLGRVDQEYDSEAAEFRDMQKPVRRESLSLSPRLAKILINCSGAKPGFLLLDPFCGIGGILIESLLKGIKCHGIDKDTRAIADAGENLVWLKKNYGVKVSYLIEHGDAKRTPDLQFAAVATESPLGSVLRKRPSKVQAKKIIRDFEAFIVPVLRRVRSSKKRDAKIAITFPAMRDAQVDCQKIAEKTNLKILHGPILESRPDQFISRDIVIFK